MSITMIEPATRTTPAVLLHEGVWTETGEAPVPRTAGRRFPQGLRGAAAPRRQRCTVTPAVLPAPGPLPDREPRPASAPDIPAGPRPEPATAWNPRVPEDDALEVPEEVRPLIEKIFPRAGSMANLEESVATVVHAVAPAVLEVLAGARPAHQLVNALNPECMGKLEQHRRIWQERRPDPGTCCYSNPRVLRIRISEVLPLVFEAAVVLLDAQKVRATALRIERWHGRWQVTALEIG
ncbi:Rv3235 family protein [Paeniglutamicibacter sp. R2-26]|uniref:Rv3235 family protein n=1 Tax=Paeniglutamicibacter sp. R2-26 TaxID=3144417 RepID=UPI003EE6A4C4